MSKEDKKLQKHLVDEMMKVYETNPDVMLYMQSLMENYEKIEQENKQLKEALLDIKNYIANNSKKFEDMLVSGEFFEIKNILDIVNKILGDKENE